MIHPIRLFGDPVLRRRALSVTSFDEGLESLVADMLETMYAAEGVGLAAPQIGVSRRVFVALELPEPTDDDDDAVPLRLRVEHVMVNPVITRRAGQQLARDGCLSIPGLTVEDLPRDLVTAVSYQDLVGVQHSLTADGYFAHVLQHEYDHLEGVFYFDHLPEPRRRAFLEEHRRELAEMQRNAKAYLRGEKGARDAQVGRAPVRP